MSSYFKEISKSYTIIEKKLKKDSIYHHFCKTLIEQYRSIKVENFAFFM